MGTDLFLYGGVALQVAFAAAAGAMCLAGCRWTSRVWPPLALVLGLGVIIRAWIGLGLFAISYLNLPILASLHTGDGFWHLAPDARAYHELAAAAAGGAPVPPGSPSPSFLEVLGLWMRVAGDSPASAVLFNLVLYVGTCVMLVAAFRPLNGSSERRAALISVSAFTFSPVLILLGTQSLKDVFSGFLVVVTTVALLFILTTTARPAFRRDLVLMVGCIAVAVYLMAGIRAYYALFIWAAVAVALAVRTVMMPRRAAIPWVPFAGGVLVLLWCAFMWGAGPYYAHYGELLTRTAGMRIPGISPRPGHVAVLPPSDEVGIRAARSRVDSLRRGFVQSGGATNLGERDASREESRVRALLTGLAALFIPITALLQFSVVEFSGGRGFLLVTDLDTIFVNLALLAVAWVLVRSGVPVRRNLPFFCFALGLGLVSAVLMAYVVTNYGTLFRLRLLAIVPLWVLPLALRHTAAVVPDVAQGTSGSRSPAMETRERGIVQAPGAA